MLFFLFKLFVCACVCARFRMSKSHNTKEQKYCICFGVVIYCEVVAHCELHHCLRKNIV